MLLATSQNSLLKQQWYTLHVNDMAQYLRLPTGGAIKDVHDYRVGAKCGPGQPRHTPHGLPLREGSLRTSTRTHVGACLSRTFKMHDERYVQRRRRRRGRRWRRRRRRKRRRRRRRRFDVGGVLVHNNPPAASSDSRAAVGACLNSAYSCCTVTQDHCEQALEPKSEHDLQAYLQGECLYMWRVNENEHSSPSRYTYGGSMRTST